MFLLLNMILKRYFLKFYKLVLFVRLIKMCSCSSCPYDVLKVYDFQKLRTSRQALTRTGKKQTKASNYERQLIDIYCGRKLNFTLYSTFNMLELEFEMSNSLGNEEYAEDENRILLRKGFKAHFKFSKYFADLAFITGTHIIGTSTPLIYTLFWVKSFRSY